MMNFDHPNIVKIFGYDSTGHEVKIIEEFCEAGDLLSFFVNYKKENPGKLIAEKAIKYITK